MSPSPASSFLKFFVGFTVFIGISFGLTYAIQRYDGERVAQRAQAAAAAEMLEYKK